MKRLLLVSLALLLLIPLSLLAWLSLTESGLHWAYQQAGPYLPSGLRINALHGRLIGPLTLHTIEYRQDGNIIRADQLVLNWQPTALLTGRVDISQLKVQGLAIDLPVSAKTGQPFVLPEISLPWRVVLKGVELNQISFTQGEQQLELGRVWFDASTLFSQVDIHSLGVETDELKLEIKGELSPTRDYRHDLDIRWQAGLPTGREIKGRGQLMGNMQSTRLEQQLLTPLPLSLKAEINDLLGEINWQASIEVTKFDASKIDTHWPALRADLTVDANGDLNTAQITGKLQGEHPATGVFNSQFRLQRLADNTIVIDELKLDAPVSNTHINTTGQWLPGDNGGQVKLVLDWRNLRWPLEGPAWFNSAEGNGTLEGGFDRYRLNINTDSPWPELLASSWSAIAEGNTHGMTFHSLKVNALSGEASATGQLNWSPSLNWNAEISTRNIDPAGLWPDWPGKLRARLSSAGQIVDGQLTSSANIHQLDGTLRGYPVSLRSQLRWQDNGLELDLFELHSGQAEVSARGRLGDTLKLDWAINASNLAELYPGAEGELRAEGLLSGPREAPALAASFNGRALVIPGYGIGTINGAVVLDRQDWQQIDIRLMAENLRLNNYSLQSLNIDANKQQLKVSASTPEASAHIELKGELDARGWQGHVERIDILSQGYTQWKLKQPTRLEVSETNVTSDWLCLQDTRQASICTSLQRINELWESKLSIDKLPLRLLNPWIPPDLKFDGVVTADVELAYQYPQQLLGRAQIELPAGTLNYPLLEGERDQWNYRQGKADITLDTNGLKASAELAMGNGDRLHGQLLLPGAKLLALNTDTQSIQASAELTMHNLGLLEAILPEVHELRGEMEVRLKATGTMNQPRLKSFARLTKASVRIPRLGLNIEPISLKAESDSFEKINFQMNARSGEGKLSIRGQTELDSKAGWPTEININGNDFEISRIPEARVVITPDLQVALKNRSINIKGKVHIPYADLQPKDITTAIRVSNDTVIIDADQAQLEQWQIHTQIRLTLGERVNFFGFGFEGRLGGSLLLEDEPGQLTKGTGEINIPEGRYRAYGQHLKVEHGRLLYTGGPLSNPGLDIRAIRQVNNVTAGLKVRGSLNQPQIELFSIPAMGQTDALAYLLLGRPIETTSGEEGAMMAKATLALGLSGGDRIARLLGSRFGLDEMRVESSDTGEQASLVMGRYLSPKLYISYGVGLVEAFNTLTVRYQISEKWQLKAESGESHGADVLYTIER